MHVNPSVSISKLSDMGIAIGSSNPLTQKVIDVRTKRHVFPYHVDNKDKSIDYTPEIQGKGRPLQEIPKNYIKDVLNFVGYVESTKKRSFLIKMKNITTGELYSKVKPYVHRWTDVYRRGVMAKFYALEAYLGNNVSDVIMITLTTSSRNKTYEAVLDELKGGRKKLLDVLRWKYGTVDYFWVFEYHKSGFSHIHIAYFYSIPLSERVWLKHLWADKYGHGSFENGLDFVLPKASSDGSVPVGVIGSIRKYLTKYVSKGLHPIAGSEPCHEVFVCGRKVSLGMSPAELLFNALLKKTKTRLWGCSRNFSKIMKRPETEKSDEWECVEVDQYYGMDPEEKELYPDESEEEKSKHFFSVLWTKEGGLRPNEAKKLKFIVRVPNESIHLPFYQNLKFKGYEFKTVGNFTSVFEPVWVSTGGTIL